MKTDYFSFSSDSVELPVPIVCDSVQPARYTQGNICINKPSTFSDVKIAHLISAECRSCALKL